MKTKLLFITIAILIIALSSVAQETGTFTDVRDGKTYKTVKIGTQTWMAENLAYKMKTGCWAYDKDSNNVKTYGYLYNWESAKNGCPSGWHLPSDSEWTKLTDYLGGATIAGGKLKSTTIWNSPNTGASNSSGFTALPGGIYRLNGSFVDMYHYNYFWSSTEFNIKDAYYRGMKYDESDVNKDNSNKNNGYSVRCVKDK